MMKQSSKKRNQFSLVYFSALSPKRIVGYIFVSFVAIARVAYVGESLVLITVPHIRKYVF